MCGIFEDNLQAHLQKFSPTSHQGNLSVVIGGDGHKLKLRYCFGVGSRIMSMLLSLSDVIRRTAWLQDVSLWD